MHLLLWCMMPEILALSLFLCTWASHCLDFIYLQVSMHVAMQQKLKHVSEVKSHWPTFELLLQLLIYLTTQLSATDLICKNPWTEKIRPWLILATKLTEQGSLMLANDRLIHMKEHPSVAILGPHFINCEDITGLTVARRTVRLQFQGKPDSNINLL